MIELEECREDGNGELISLCCEGWVDKSEFRDACTEWLADEGYYAGIERRIERGLDGFFDPHAARYLAAPELEHIEHSRWSLVPACILDTGRRCHPDCDCPVYFVRSKPHGRGDKYTVWDVEQALRRHWKYVDQQQTAQAQREG